MDKGTALDENLWVTKELYGVLPSYDEAGGNGSRLLFKGGDTRQDKRRVKTIISNLARLYQKDIRAVNKKASEISGQRTMNVLPLSPDTILVPIKVRRPIGKDDGATGYIVFKAVDKVCDLDCGCRVLLKDGQCIDILERLSTIEKRMAFARHMTDYTYLCCKMECAEYEVNSELFSLSQNIINLLHKYDIIKGR